MTAYDSKLSPGDAKNSILAACADTFAMVGTTATFLNDVTPMEQCPDKSGAATGIPDMPVVQTEPVQQCSRVSYSVLPAGYTCPYSGTGERAYATSSGPFDYYLKHNKDLHGVWVIPKDLPSTISASMPGFRASQEIGIKRDAEVGASGLDTQSAYTAIAQTIKEKGSTYARNGLDYKGSVFLRKESQIQGVNTVKVWDCSLQCYDPRFITEGGSAVEGQYTWMSFLPFEDKGSNDTLDAFLKYDKTPDGFGAQAFAAGELFAQVANDIVADKGPNGLTRGGRPRRVEEHQAVRCRWVHPADRRRCQDGICVLRDDAGQERQVRTGQPHQARHLRLHGEGDHDHDRSAQGVPGVTPAGGSGPGMRR